MSGAVARARLEPIGRVALSPAGLLVVLTGLAGIALRVWTYRASITIPTSDEALIGLMVTHFEHGGFTTFFWGRPYGGTQEVILAVPGFFLFGASWFALRIVPIVISAATALLLWRVGRRTIGDPGAAVAAGLFWVWPPFDLLQFVRAQGFYASGVFYCVALVLLALRVVERPDRLRVGLFGLVGGLAFWQSAQITPVALVAIAWTIWKQPRCLRHAWIAALLALLGSLPWWIWNVGHGFASLQQDPGIATYRHSLRLLLSPLSAMTVGLRAPYTDQLLIPSTPLTWLVLVGLVTLFLVSAYRSRGAAVSLVYWILLIFPFLYALPRKTSYISSYPQYTTIVTPLLALLLARLATSRLRGALMIALACMITGVTLNRMEAWYALPQPLPNAPRSFAPLIATLDRLHLDRVYADYWIAYRLTFETGERVVAVENPFTSARLSGGQVTPADDPEVRYAPYQREVKAARHGFVFWRQTLGSVGIVGELEQHAYRHVDVGPWVVFAPPLR